MKNELNKLVKNELLNSSELFKLCQTCYDEFIERAVNHKEDQGIEAHNMEVTLKHLAEYEKS